MKRTLVLLTLVLSLILLVAVAGCTSDSEPAEPAAETETQESAPEEEAAPAETETDPDMALVESKCSLCHTTERVYAADYDRATWEATMDRMKANGLVITDEEYEQIVAYLSGE